MDKQVVEWKATHMIMGLIIILLIISLIFCTCTETGKQYFENMKNMFKGTNIKDLDMVMFMNPSCPHCMKMMDMLEKEKQIHNLEIVDITTKEGLEYASRFGADKQPVPSFISRKLKTATKGSKESLKKLVEDLTIKKQEPSSMEEQNVNIDLNFIRDLQIVLFAREGCPWCVKAKESCDEQGITDFIKVVSITTPEGQELASQVLPPGSAGVPAWVSLKTKKSVIGYEPIGSIVNKLSN